MTSGAVVANDQPIPEVVDANDVVKGAFVEDSVPFIISAAIHPVVSTVAFNNTTPNRCIDVDVRLFGIYSTK